MFILTTTQKKKVTKIAASFNKTELILCIPATLQPESSGTQVTSAAPHTKLSPPLLSPRHTSPTELPETFAMAH